MRRLIAVTCASVMLAGAASGCFVSRKETVREPRTSTYEKHSTVETAPGDTEIRTKTTIDHD